MKLSGVMLNSDQPKVLGEFYTKFLGKAGWQDGEWYGFDIGGGNLMIGPHSEVTGKNAMPPRIMLSIECDDVSTECAKIKDSGATVVAEPYNPDEGNKDLWLATLADPDGNYLQLSTPWKE